MLFERNAELKRRQNDAIIKEKRAEQQQRQQAVRAKREALSSSRDMELRNEFALRMATADRRIELMERRRHSTRIGQVTPVATSQMLETTLVPHQQKREESNGRGSTERPAEISNHLYNRLLGNSVRRILESSKNTAL